MTSVLRHVRRARRQPVAPDVVREDYRSARRALLRSLLRLDRAEGLEVGAFDFLTVSPEIGRCAVADVRSSEELARLFDVPVASIARVDYVLERRRPLAEQIPRRFDYVVLCHVLEHVPDPIGFLNDAARLLNSGGVLFLALPDKRYTLDASRPSTTVEELLECHHERATMPSLARLMEFARTWCETWRKLAAEAPKEFYDWAIAELAAGHADAHCQVWRDEEMFAQLDYLVRGGFFPGLVVCLRSATCADGIKEFYIALRKDGDATAP